MSGHPDIMTSVRPEESLVLRDLAAGKRVLEVGSWRGYSTVTMALVAECVHAVDWHLGDDHAGHDESLPHLWENLGQYGVRDKVVLYVGDAGVVLPMLPRGYFDFAFIDAFHTTEAVKRDADLVLPLVHTGGIIAFHDYGDDRFGVKEAVDSLENVVWISLTATLAVVGKT